MAAFIIFLTGITIFLLCFLSFFSVSLCAVIMDEPRFAQPIPNVTVAVGRDANLPCVVEHLGAYKVCILYLYSVTVLILLLHTKYIAFVVYQYM